MAENDSLTDAGAALRRHFLGWQCRIRQHAMRREAGRPSEGMRPALQRTNGDDLGRIIVVICEAEPDATTDQFRHIVQRTMDPQDRFKKAVQFLSSAYFQKADLFCDALLALFGAGTTLAEIAEDQRCVLAFRQFSQSYRLPCRIERLQEDHRLAQALIWHNRMFNPNMPPDVIPVAFWPIWDEGTAFPPAG
ncbi:MAG: hypothetical protein AAF563_24325 [Pseudomonadota bacterium]